MLKKPGNILFSVFLFFLSGLCFCQGSKIDSLKLACKKIKAACALPCIQDTIRLNMLIAISEECEINEILQYAEEAVTLSDKILQHSSASNFKNRILKQKAAALNNIGFVYSAKDLFPDAKKYYETCLKIQEDIGDNKGIATSLHNIGYIFDIHGEYFKALEYYRRSLQIRNGLMSSLASKAERDENKKEIAKSVNNIGAIYAAHGDIPAALDYYHQCLKLEEETSDKKEMANTLNNIGYIHLNQNEAAKALSYFNRGRKINIEIGDQAGMATSLNNIGIIYERQGQIARALEMFYKSSQIYSEIGDKQGIANTLNNTAEMYKKTGNKIKGHECLLKSLKLYEEIDDKRGIASLLHNVGSSYLAFAFNKTDAANKQKNLLLAFLYCDSSLVLSKKIGLPEQIRNAEKLLSVIDSIKGNFKGVLQHYQQYTFFKDSLNNNETRKASIKSQLNYEFEKKEAVIREQQEKDREIAGETNRKQQIIIGAVIVGLIFVVVFALFVFRSLKTARQQKITIEEKQKEILDSIHYAKRIQSSLLPNEKYINKTLNRLNKK